MTPKLARPALDADRAPVAKRRIPVARPGRCREPAVSRTGGPVVASVSFTARGRCLGDQLTVATPTGRWRRRPCCAGTAMLVVCQCCRAAVDEERRVLSALRGPSAGSPVPGDLRGDAAGAGHPDAALPTVEGGVDRRRAPDARRPSRSRPFRSSTVGTPALHRSAGRATVYAGLAAGCHGRGGRLSLGGESVA